MYILLCAVSFKAPNLIYNIFTVVNSVFCSHIGNVVLYWFTVLVHTVWAVFAEAQNVLSHSPKMALCHYLSALVPHCSCLAELITKV